MSQNQKHVAYLNDEVDKRKEHLVSPARDKGYTWGVALFREKGRGQWVCWGYHRALPKSYGDPYLISSLSIIPAAY